MQLSIPQLGFKHMGLQKAIKSSTESLQKGWDGKDITVADMFQSFSIMQKQMCLPLHVVQKLWGVEDALVGLQILSGQSLLSLLQDEK